MLRRLVLSFEIFGSVSATASELGVLFPKQFDGCLPRVTQMLGVGIESIAAGKRRRSRDLRQADVAKLCGVSPRWYEAFERGMLRRRFSTTFVARIADVLRLDPHDRATMFRLALSEVDHTVEHLEHCAHCR